VGIKLIEGRDLDLQRYPSDSKAVLLNETAVKLMGFKDPIGEVITDDGNDCTVTGVVKDFVLTSPYQKIQPIVFYGSTKWCSVVHIRLNTKNSTTQNIASIEALFKKHNPAYPFDYRFIDEEYNHKFAMLEGTLGITTLFGSIAIFIACLGLLGLSSFLIESKVKEIGIRKVLGGSVTSVIKLLSFNMLKPIMIGIVLFSPGAWFAMSWWLQSFDYII
jgi:ABC-type antimicrobial peptide transport system permease subunit